MTQPIDEWVVVSARSHLFDAGERPDSPRGALRRHSWRGQVDGFHPIVVLNRKDPGRSKMVKAIINHPSSINNPLSYGRIYEISSIIHHPSSINHHPSIF